LTYPHLKTPFFAHSFSSKTRDNFEHSCLQDNQIVEKLTPKVVTEASVI